MAGNVSGPVTHGDGPVFTACTETVRLFFPAVIVP